MAKTVWCIVGRYYMATETVEDVFKMDMIRIDRGWIITNIPVSKQQVSHKNLVHHLFCSLDISI